jgi:hypothetical protein
MLYIHYVGNLNKITRTGKNRWHVTWHYSKVYTKSVGVWQSLESGSVESAKFKMFGHFLSGRWGITDALIGARNNVFKRRNFFVEEPPVQLWSRASAINQRPSLNFAPRGKLWPPGAKLSPRCEFCPLGGEVIPWGSGDEITYLFTPPFF